MSDSQHHYEQARSVLSVMELSKPIALATISQKTGIRLAELIRLSKRIESAGLIRRVMDNGNTFYILLTKSYESQLVDLFFPPDQEPAAKPMSSRDAIMKRRRSQREAQSESENTRSHLSSDHLSSMSGGRFHRQKSTTGPEPLSAVDLLAMRRSSTTNPRTFDLNRSSSRMSSGSGEHERYTTPGASSSTLRSSDVFRSPASSASNKAVFMNRPLPRGPVNSRSMFTGMPPADLDPQPFERSDNKFKQINPDETRSQMPLIPLKAMPQTNNDVTESDVRTTLGIPDDMPMLTILSPRPCHDVWKSCSALANVGGGVLVLGMRKYVHGNDITYYIKSVNHPEESIKQLLKAFNDRNIISDCPKDPNFIEMKDFGRKKVIVLHIDPAQLSPAPLFTARDSFGMRTTSGCYIYRDGEVVHCTEEEIKELWIRLRAGQEEIDWEQTGEQIDVAMERKVKLHLPPIIDDTVRPLSRRDCTYGQALPQPDLPAHLRGYAAKPDIRNRPDYLPLYPTADDFLKNTAETSEQCIMQAKAQQLPLDNMASAPKNSPLEKLISEGDVDRPSRRIKTPAPERVTDAPSHPQIVKSLLLAEDIRPITTASVASSQTSTPAAAPSAANIPPKLAQADRAKLDAIAAPAIQHPRLPTARLCEIAITLCQHACLKPAELAEILNRKLVPVRDRVMPKIKEHPNVHCVDNIYYYIDK